MLLLTFSAKICRGMMSACQVQLPPTPRLVAALSAAQLNCAVEARAAADCSHIGYSALIHSFATSGCVKNAATSINDEDL